MIFNVERASAVIVALALKVAFYLTLEHGTLHLIAPNGAMMFIESTMQCFDIEWKYKGSTCKSALGKLDMLSCVPFYETVTCCVSCMAQPLPTLTTVPRGGDTAMVDITVKGTVAPWTSWPITVQPDGIVPEWKGVDDSPTTTSASATTIVPDQFLCELESE